MDNPGAANENIFILSAAAGLYVKVLIDVLKLGWLSMPSWAAPTFALLGGVLIVMCIFVANGSDINPQRAAQAILAGLLAGGSAVTATAIQTRVTEVKIAPTASTTDKQ